MNAKLDKIRNLLTLAERASTEGERDAALAAAQRLMARYNVTLSQVENHVVDRFATCEEIAEVCGRTRPEMGAVAGVLDACFFVRCYKRRYCREYTEVRIFGEPHNVAVAVYVHVFLCREFRKRWRTRCRQTGHRRGAASYFSGLAVALIDRLQGSPSIDERTALMRLDGRLGEAFEAANPGLKRQLRDIDDESQHFAGVRDAHDLVIHTPLPGEVAHTPLIGVDQ